MQYVGMEAPEALRRAIKGFWYTSIDFNEYPAGFEIIPDGYAEIIFLFGSACSVATSGGSQPLPSPFLMGLLGQPVRLHAPGRVEIMGVKCFPWAVFELLGLPAGPGGVQVFEHPVAQLQAPLAALVQAGQVAEALALVRQYFLSTQPAPAPDQLLTRAGQAMSATHGTLPVHQVAAAAHATVRTLERKFKQAAGRTVKDVSGLMRFEQVRNCLWREPTASLAGLAQELGYADQAHLSRDFKRYCGATPAAFARQARRGQPVVGRDFVAFIQA
ncbi:MAG TPA: helix-turn-helix domain-containing protein [Hymenobacter sp.]|uniref:AraC family transcriptional regulator n=1 Tax=Hymenobacter sp. TaxID=1898978 RepID=UPI002D7FBF46|nr:helix-turn-helix domain-containing protein [Hymenobacter sp.]HET9503179.1 helix-turn-helix domain-containing protein [Hymenobacter sp.]